MTIKSFLNILQKNFRIFFRTKTSAFFIIFLPLIIVLLSGYAFNSSTLSGLTISTYSDSYTLLTDSIISDFTNQGYTVKKSLSQKDCIDSVKLTNSQICIVFPSDLSINGSSEEVIFHIDYSRINLAYTLIHEVENKISLQAQDLGVVLAQDLIDSLSLAKTHLKSSKDKIDKTISSLKSSQKDFSSEEISLDKIDETISLLEDAKNSANNSETLNNIKESITLLEKIKQETDQANENLEDLNKANEQIIDELEQISSSLEEIITSLSSSNLGQAQEIVSPINTKIESIKVNSKNRDYLLPTILTLISLFGGVLLSSTFVLKEKKTKAYFRNFMTPTRDTTFIMATFLTCIIILFLQFILVFLGIKFLLQMELSFYTQPTILVLFLSFSAFAFLGMFLGYIFKSEETTIFASVIISTILMFFSNALIPIESISQSLQDILKYNPVIITDIALKKLILFNFSFTAIYVELIALASFALLFAILTYFARKITKRKL